MSTALTPELTSFSALKALVAMSSSWEPGVVRFKMFSTSILRRVTLWNGKMRKEVRGSRWHTGDSSRRARMPGNLGFSRLDSGRGALSLMGPSTLLPHGGTSPLSWV